MVVGVAAAPAPDPLWRRVIGFPSTRAGRVAAWLSGGVMAGLALAGGLVAAGVPEWGWGAKLMLALGTLAGVSAAVVAGGVALRALVAGERSIVVLGPLLFGVFCLLFLLGLVVP